MAIRPPMNDTISIFGVKLDEFGNPELDRRGLEVKAKRTTIARVKYSGERVFTARGDETVAKLEIKVPAEFQMREGEPVEWVDQFGETVESRVAAIKDVLDYPGVVQYRKVWTE